MLFSIEGTAVYNLQGLAALLGGMQQASSQLPYIRVRFLNELCFAAIMFEPLHLWLRGFVRSSVKGELTLVIQNIRPRLDYLLII